MTLYRVFILLKYKHLHELTYVSYPIEHERLLKICISIIKWYKILHNSYSKESKSKEYKNKLELNWRFLNLDFYLHRGLEKLGSCDPSPFPKSSLVSVFVHFIFHVCFCSPHDNLCTLKQLNMYMYIFYTILIPF